METVVFLHNPGLGESQGYRVCEQNKAELVITQVPPGFSQLQVAAIANATTIRCFAHRCTEVPLSRLGQGKVISIF